MLSVQDLNSYSRMIFSGRSRQGVVGDLNVVSTREDVLPVLLELRDSLNRLFQRLQS